MKQKKPQVIDPSAPLSQRFGPASAPVNQANVPWVIATNVVLMQRDLVSASLLEEAHANGGQIMDARELVYLPVDDVSISEIYVFNPPNATLTGAQLGQLTSQVSTAALRVVDMSIAFHCEEPCKEHL